MPVFFFFFKFFWRQSRVYLVKGVVASWKIPPSPPLVSPHCTRHRPLRDTSRVCGKCPGTHSWKAKQWFLKQVKVIWIINCAVSSWTLDDRWQWVRRQNSRSEATVGRQQLPLWSPVLTDKCSSELQALCFIESSCITRQRHQMLAWVENISHAFAKPSA